jgi:hypothetical protein
MATKDGSTVVGIFGDRSRVREAVCALKQVGFREEQIGVVAPSQDTGPAARRALGCRVAEGAAAGAGIGFLWALGVAANVFPPLGVVAGGSLSAVLAGAGAGATVAALVAALASPGLPGHEARSSEGEAHSGCILVTVKADRRYDEAWAVLHLFGGAYNAETSPRRTGAPPRGGCGGARP